MDPGDIFSVELLADGSDMGREKIHEQLPCLLSMWSEWWHLTVAHQPEEQDRDGAGRGTAHFGQERFRAESTSLTVT